MERGGLETVYENERVPGCVLCSVKKVTDAKTVERNNSGFDGESKAVPVVFFLLFFSFGFLPSAALTNWGEL